MLSFEGVERMFVFSVSLLSIVSCSWIVVTYLLFKKLQKKQSVICIVFMALCLIVASTVSAFGFLGEGSFACLITSALSRFCSLSALIWTTIITCMLYYLAITGKIFKIGWQHHAISWAIPVIFIFVPYLLADGNYGTTYYCDWVLVDNGRAPAGFALSILPFIVCAIIMVVALLRALLILSYSPEGATKTWLAVVLHKLQFYPVFVIIQISLSLAVYRITSYTRCMRGILAGLIFFCMNDDVRLLWYGYMASIPGLGDSLTPSFVPEKKHSPKAVDPLQSDIAAASFMTGKAQPMIIAASDAHNTAFEFENYREGKMKPITISVIDHSENDESPVLSSSLLLSMTTRKSEDSTTAWGSSAKKVVAGPPQNSIIPEANDCDIVDL